MHENVLQNTPNRTIDKKSNTPKHSVRSNTLSIILINFFYQNILQNVPNCIIFLKKIFGEVCHALHDASRHANTPTFQKIF